METRRQGVYIIAVDVDTFPLKRWKQEGHLDEWRTTSSWRILCEIYAKLMGLLLQHWLCVLFAWHDPHRSLVKLSQTVRQTAHGLQDPAGVPRNSHRSWMLPLARLAGGSDRDGEQKNGHTAGDGGHPAPDAIALLSSVQEKPVT